MVTVSAVRKRGDYYYYNGKVYPAVTAILSVIAKPALVPWAVRQACEAIWSDPETCNSYERVYAAVMARRDHGASKGTTIHSLAESLERGGEIVVEDLPESIRGYGVAFREFVARERPQVLFTEANCYSDRYGYAGTIDLIAVLSDGLTYLCDYKTGKEVYREAALQIEAYRNTDFILPRGDATPVELPQIHKTAIVLLRPDGTHEFREVRGDLSTFLAAKTLWEALRG